MRRVLNWQSLRIPMIAGEYRIAGLPRGPLYLEDADIAAIKEAGPQCNIIIEYIAPVSGSGSWVFLMTSN